MTFTFDIVVYVLLRFIFRGTVNTISTNKRQMESRLTEDKGPEMVVV